MVPSPGRDAPLMEVFATTSNGARVPKLAMFFKALLYKKNHGKVTWCLDAIEQVMYSSFVLISSSEKEYTPKYMYT